MFDLTRSYFKDIKERAVAPGATVTDEGQLLVYVDDGAGGIAVQPCAGGGGEHPAGFAITDSAKYTSMPVLEEVHVPATPEGETAAPYNHNLASGGVVAGSLVCTDAAGAAVAVTVNDVNGILTIPAAQAGKTVKVLYRHTLTLAQATATFFQRSINGNAQDYFHTVAVGCLEGEVFTSLYDTAAAYKPGDEVFCADGGMVTSAEDGAPVGIVTRVPTAGDGGLALLGVKFILPLKT